MYDDGRNYDVREIFGGEPIIEVWSKLMIETKTNNKKLYTVLSYWGVFTFCTCCKISNLSRVYCR